MDYFFVKPNNLESDNDTVYQININDIYYLSLLATTLKPLPEITENIGYAVALDEYYSQNADNYSECYHNLISSSDGKIFLCTSIKLMLLEKQFKNFGINEKNLQAYKIAIQDYQHQIEFNKSMFTEQKHSNIK